MIESVASRHARPDDVADIVQSVGMTICTRLNGAFATGQIRSWVYRVTVNEARMHHRREARQQNIQERIQQLRANRVPDPQDLAERSERITGLQDAIERLRPQDRVVARDEIATGGILHTRMQRWRTRNRLRDLMS